MICKMEKFIGFYNLKIKEEQLFCFIEEGFVELYHSNRICLLAKSSQSSGLVKFIKKGDLATIVVGNISNLNDLKRLTTESASSQNPLEIICNLFMQMGEELLDLLDGSFAIAIWDDKNQFLHFCRDDAGTKLLYYQRIGEGLIFSNEIKEIIRASGSKKLSDKSLVEYFRFLDISPPYTIFEDIVFLEPEAIVSISASGMKKREKNEPVQDSYNGETDYLERFENFLLNSVDNSLKLKGRTGVFLSGGIDSSLVCAIAASMDKNVKAITVGFEDPRFDESQIAKNIAKYLKIGHDVFFFSLAQDFEAFHDFTSTIPSPFADPAIIPTFQCFRNIGATMDNMLDGTGADTLIGIMPANYIHFILNFSRYLPLAIRRKIVRVLSQFKHGRKHIDLFDYEDPVEPLIRWNGWDGNEIQKLTKLKYSIEHTMFYKLFVKNNRKSPYEIYSRLMGALPDDRVNQSSSITGVNVSFPFFDRKVQYYVRSLPMYYRYRKGSSKKLYRDLLEKYIPIQIWDVPKHGFNYKFWNLMKYNDYELIELYLSKKELMEHGMFDNTLVNEYVKRFKSGDPGVRFKIWGLVMFQAWYRNFYSSL